MLNLYVSNENSFIYLNYFYISECTVNEETGVSDLRSTVSVSSSM